MLDVKKLLTKILQNLIVQTSGDWRYITLGKAFFGGYNAQKQFAINNASGNIFLSPAQTITYPVTLSSIPYAGVSCTISTYPTWTVVNSTGASTGISYSVASSLSRTSTTYRIKAFTFGVLE